MVFVQLVRWTIAGLLVLTLGACASEAIPVEQHPIQGEPAVSTQALASAAPTETISIAGTQTEVPVLATAIPTETLTEGTIFRGPLSVVITAPMDNSVVQVSKVEIVGEA